MGTPLGPVLTPGEGLEAAELGLDLLTGASVRPGLVAAAGAGYRLFESGNARGDLSALDADLVEDGLDLVARRGLFGLGLGELALQVGGGRKFGLLAHHARRERRIIDAERRTGTHQRGAGFVGGGFGHVSQLAPHGVDLVSRAAET